MEKFFIPRKISIRIKISNEINNLNLLYEKYFEYTDQYQRYSYFLMMISGILAIICINFIINGIGKYFLIPFITLVTCMTILTIYSFIDNLKFKKFLKEKIKQEQLIESLISRRKYNRNFFSNQKNLKKKKRQKI